MNPSQLSWITNYIWGIADDVLRDLYVRGKYRDVILPMTVLRRLDAVLEDNKKAVLDMKASLDKAGVIEQDQALRQAAGQAFYNTSKFTLRDLRARASRQQLKADFEAYLDGFSPNVQDILDNFEFRNQIPRLSKADALGTLIEKLTSPDINLNPEPVKNADGSIKHPGLDNHGMGSIFEELVRKFNEENNEEAGEHWTPRDAVKLMAKLIFRFLTGFASPVTCRRRYNLRQPSIEKESTMREECPRATRRWRSSWRRAFLGVAIVSCLSSTQLSEGGEPDRERAAEASDGDLITIRAEEDGGQRTYFLNGIEADGASAIVMATVAARRLACGLTLAYVDCESAELDFVAIASSKLGDFDTELNAAADRLLPVVLADLRAGRTVRLIGHSLGGAIIQNLVNEIGGRVDQSEADLLRRVHVVLLGAAVFGPNHALSDGWPTGVRVFSISDAGDEVAMVVGDIDDDWIDVEDSRHSCVDNYLQHLSPRVVGLHGRLVVDRSEVLLEEVAWAPNPKDRVIRWQVWRIPGEDSRRTLNAVVPRSWKRVRWSVVGHPDPNSVCFALIEDVPLWPDDTEFELLEDGSVTGHVSGDYLGRVKGSGLNERFYVEARPLLSGE